MHLHRVRRREFITLVGGAAAWPLAARAQQPGKVWRIGMLSAVSASTFSGLYAAFLRGMREQGYLEGKDFVVEWRSAQGKYERFSEIAAEFVRLNVDVIVTATGSALATLKQATSTIPIVMVSSTDPVGTGLVASLARPGGNMTGLANSFQDTSPKQLELLATVVPNLSRVGFLWNPDGPAFSPVLKNAQDAARKAGLLVVAMEARNPQEIENAFAELAKQRVQALMVGADAMFFEQQQRIAELALKSRLPTIFSSREYAEAGGLMSYGESLADFFRHAAVFVDKIFKGARPADLPIEQPTLFKLVINRKTADALEITIPPQLYIFADEVIE
jgi:putative ABC transport system substrate-binding protein